MADIHITTSELGKQSTDCFVTPRAANLRLINISKLVQNQYPHIASDIALILLQRSFIYADLTHSRCTGVS